MIIFKTDRQRSEFNHVNIDSRIKIVLFAISGYVHFKYNLPAEITEIFREQIEQDEIYLYKSSPEIAEQYKKEKWYSVHQYWRGVDIVIRGVEQNIYKDIEKFVVDNFVYTSIKYKTGLYHNIGVGEHVHLQVDTDNYTEIKKLEIPTNDDIEVKNQ